MTSLEPLVESFRGLYCQKSGILSILETKKILWYSTNIVAVVMSCQPPHFESLSNLRKLQQEVASRGDSCLAMLLAGVEAYIAVGREWELLDVMRQFAHDAQYMVENTPTADELRKLFEQD